jgi:beta-glucosidase-like glycosyl hydrolase
VGVNLNFAPVLDLAIDTRNSVIGTRSYGSDPAGVASMGAAVIQGFGDEGVLACAKHFPGHGATEVDSHLDLPTLRSTPEEVEQRDLVPFRRAIRVGCAAIMTAHVMSALDPEMPTTLSKPALTGQLRGQMGFDGLILTDALEMKALAKTGVALEQLGLQALRAGADLLVFEGNADQIEATARSLEEALARGEIDEGLLRSSARRLAAARGWITRKTEERWPLDEVGSEDHATVSRQVAMAGISISDPTGLLPLGTPPVVLPTSGGYDFAATVGWPLPTDGGLPSPGTPVVVVVEAEELSDCDRSNVAALEASGAPVVLVMLGGWQLPSGVRAAASICGYDLPRSFWPLIAARLCGLTTPDGGRSFQSLSRRG